MDNKRLNQDDELEFWVYTALSITTSLIICVALWAWYFIFLNLLGNGVI